MTKTAVFLAAILVLIMPVFTDAADRGVLNNIGNFLAGEACLVPVYHQEFAFPPEGGQLVRKDGQLYFYRNYLPECVNYLSGAQVVQSARTQPVDNYYQVAPVTNYQSDVFTAVPRYVAPQTGCN